MAEPSKITEFGQASAIGPLTFIQALTEHKGFIRLQTLHGHMAIVREAEEMVYLNGPSD